MQPVSGPIARPREAQGSNLTVGDAGEEHLTIDLRKSASRATDVTAGELGARREQPPGSSQPGLFVEHVTPRAPGDLRPLHRPLAVSDPPSALTAEQDQKEPSDPSPGS